MKSSYAENLGTLVQNLAQIPLQGPETPFFEPPLSPFANFSVGKCDESFSDYFITRGKVGWRCRAKSFGEGFFAGVWQW